MDAALDYLAEFAISHIAAPHISIMYASNASNDYHVGPCPVSRLPQIDLPKFDGYLSDEKHSAINLKR